MSRDSRAPTPRRGRQGGGPPGVGQRLAAIPLRLVERLPIPRRRLIEGRHGVLERRKVEVRRHLFFLRRNEGFLWVGRG